MASRVTSSAHQVRAAYPRRLFSATPLASLVAIQISLRLAVLKADELFQAPGRGSEQDWFTPSRQFSSDNGPLDGRTASSNPLARTNSSPRKPGKSPRTPASKGGFADLTDTEIGAKERRITAKDLEAEMRSLNKQNDDLDDESQLRHPPTIALRCSALTS
eukprot:2753857-Rhodomonas_salina.4